MTQSPSDDEPELPLAQQLGQRLRELSAIEFDQADGGRDSWNHAPSMRRPAPPLPSLNRETAVTAGRPATPEAAAVAELILVRAGHRPHPALVVERPPAFSHSESPPSDEAPTLLPTAAVIADANGDTYSLAEGETIVIGRRPELGGIVVNSLEVSRRHAKVEFRLGQLLATDLGSTNGTRVVAATAVTALHAHAPAVLNSGDRVVAGSDVLLCIVLAEGGPI